MNKWIAMYMEEWDFGDVEECNGLLNRCYHLSGKMAWRNKKLTSLEKPC